MNRKIPIVSATGRDDLESNTQKILERFQPAALVAPVEVDVEQFLECVLPEKMGIDFDYRQTPNGVYGWTDSERMEVVISSDLAEAKERSKRRLFRSTAGHECGHVVKHVRQIRQQSQILRSVHDTKHSSPILYRQDEMVVYCNPEWQAWWWCKAFLMPAAAVFEAIRQGMQERDMVEAFNLNGAFVRRRIADLKNMGKI